MLRSFACFAIASLVFACAPSADDGSESEQDIVSSKVDDEWFYSGSLPELDDPSVVASLAGHTAHVSGYLPAGVSIPALPHVIQKSVGGRTHVDIVYPIATAADPSNNSGPGNYAFQGMRPYRPNGPAFTHQEGWHNVTWGGFPFIAYNGGIAFHGPITDEVGETGDASVWYLRRGNVSHGCNRMMGEHVVEMTHLLGTSMRKLYPANTIIAPARPAPKVKVLKDYDTLDGKYIDVDYPTDTGARRPAAIYGADKVVMFGSWIAAETPDGRDLPQSMEWEGGVSGHPYVFAEHGKEGVVCSMPKSSLAQLKQIAASRGGELPANFCATKRACDQRTGRVCKPSELGL